MKSEEIRKRFLAFFEKRGHAIIPSAPLVPLNDPSVLFNTAGMQPLVPYLLGQKHPQGTRIADVQKCVRTGDLDDIGDNRHFSFFEMMGNWSLGDYFKQEAINWSFEFLTSKEEGLGLDVSRLYITIFEGDENAPYDQESKDIWIKAGIPENRIYALPAEDNWWSPGDNGPCGPCSEMFYDMSGTVGDLNKEEFLSAVKKETVIEIWNDVFMEYEKKDGKVIGKLSQKNVDTGAGLERITAVMQGKNTAYDTDIFNDANKIIPEGLNIRECRIVLDHARTILFMICEHVTPDNKGRGYVLRRLIRRLITIIYLNRENYPIDILKIFEIFVNSYKYIYTNLDFHTVHTVYVVEADQFRRVIDEGIKLFDKAQWMGVPDEGLPSENKSRFINAHSEKVLPGEFVFDLHQTYGLQLDLILELAKERNVLIDIDDFNKKIKEHQDKSRTASAGMFKGGLANHNEKTIRLHTAHHLLLSALQTVLGKEVKQRGSNITEERLRMDFAFDRKMTDEEKKKVEELVNENISRGLNVVRREMKREDAENIGAEMEFGAKYPDTVSVYFIEDEKGNPISKEFCGGPHVSNTKELGIFKIQKEEASSAGVRRIKAILI